MGVIIPCGRVALSIRASNLLCLHQALVHKLGEAQGYPRYPLALGAACLDCLSPWHAYVRSNVRGLEAIGPQVAGLGPADATLQKPKGRECDVLFEPLQYDQSTSSLQLPRLLLGIRCNNK